MGKKRKENNVSTIAEDISVLENEAIALNQQIGSGQAPPDISILLPMIAAIKAKASESPPATEPTAE